MKKVFFTLTLISLLFAEYIQGQENNSSLMKVDYESLDSEADLSCDTPAIRSELNKRNSAMKNNLFVFIAKGFI